MFKRIFALLCSIALCFSFISCSRNNGAKYSHCEFVIPLTEDFYKVENKDFDVSDSTGDYAVAILRISFVAGINEGIPETLTPYEFGRFWVEKCDRVAYVNDGELAYCEYYDASGVRELYYLEAFFRSRYAYFVVLFAADSEKDDSARSAFLDYASGVYFTS